MKRKYENEVGLNLYTSHKTFFPIEGLDFIEFEKNYHIYLIMAKSRIFIDDSTISFDGKIVKLDLYYIEKGIKKYYKKINYQLPKELNQSNCSVSSQYPYDKLTLNIKDQEIVYKMTGKKNIKIINIDAEEILNTVINKIDFKILYIGQSYGKDGNRTAPERLKSHKKLQKILVDYSGISNKKIFIMLFEISYANIYSLDGITQNCIANKSDEDRRFKRIISEFPNYKEVINICEGALINNFKPKYNKNFKNIFPDKGHKGYKEYLELDYNCLRLELDLDFKDLYLKLNTETESTQNINYIIKYNLFQNKGRRNMFDSIFDID